MLVRKRRKKHRRQIHARWMGKLGGHVSFEEFKEVKLWCETCDASTWHEPVKVFLAQKNKREIIVDHPTFRNGIRLKCVQCGRLEKTLKKLAYARNHYGGIK